MTRGDVAACRSQILDPTGANRSFGTRDRISAPHTLECPGVKPTSRFRLAVRRGRRHTSGQPRFGLGGAVEIGEPERTYTVEPLEDPVPRERPAEPAESPAAPSPAEEPSQPQRLPAP